MKIIGDFNISVRKALKEIDPDFESYPGLVVCGTHEPDVQGVIPVLDLIRVQRENHKPFLGICFGHQLAAIEYARNVLGQKSAWSEEFDPRRKIADWDFVVYKRQYLNVGLHNGESYWNNYQVVTELLDMWQKEPNFITCQYHPEYQSSKDKPHPLLVEFLSHAKMAMQNK